MRTPNVRIKLAKWQGPIAPPRYQEPAQVVQDVPPLAFWATSGLPDPLTYTTDRRWAPVKIKCRLCGDTGKLPAYSNHGEITLPCGCLSHHEHGHGQKGPAGRIICNP